jgi:hypothetical protein
VFRELSPKSEAGWQPPVATEAPAERIPWLTLPASCPGRHLCEPPPPLRPAGPAPLRLAPLPAGTCPE